MRDHSLADIWHSSPAFLEFRGTDWMQEPCKNLSATRSGLWRLPLPGVHDYGRCLAPQIRFATCHRIMPWSNNWRRPAKTTPTATVAPDCTELPVPDCNGGAKGGDLHQRGCAPGPFSVGPRELSTSTSGRDFDDFACHGSRAVLLAGTVAGVLLAAPAFAQQPPASAPAATPPAAAPAAPTALPPGSPLKGRPEGNEAAAKLAPVAPPPLPAAADKLPTAQAGRQASISRSMPVALPIRAHCASATRVPCLSECARATRSPQSSRKTARPRLRLLPPASIVRTD